MVSPSHEVSLSLAKGLWGDAPFFVLKFGGHDCKYMAGVAWSDKEAVKHYDGNGDSSRVACIKLARVATPMLGELLAKEESSKS